MRVVVAASTTQNSRRAGTPGYPRQCTGSSTAERQAVKRLEIGRFKSSPVLQGKVYQMSHYCIVKAGLSPGVMAAMFIHAAGESSPGKLPPNTRAIALQAESQKLSFIKQQLVAYEVDHQLIEEDGELLAIGISPKADDKRVRKITSSLPLVR